MGQEKSFFFGGGAVMQQWESMLSPAAEAVGLCVPQAGVLPQKGADLHWSPQDKRKGGMGLRPLPWAMQQLMGPSVGWGGVEYHRD